MLISIIMPVYRTEPFIAEAIDSVLGQTYPHWELVIIDDGSPDQAPAIAESYAEKDKRIKVIHQANQGVSVARNTGIKQSIGEYIAFLDSDDYYFPYFLQEMVNKIKTTHCESVYCGYIDEKNNSTIYGPPYAEGNILECYALHKQHIWINAFIIKKAFLKKYNIWFSKEFLGPEDQEFIIKYGVYVETKAVARPCCFYRYNENSLMNTLKGKRVKHSLAARKTEIQYIINNFTSPHKKQVIEYFKLLYDTEAYTYLRDTWKAIVKDKRYDEVIRDLKDFGRLTANHKKNKLKNAFRAIIINSHNIRLWKLVSLISKRN